MTHFSHLLIKKNEASETYLGSRPININNPSLLVGEKKPTNITSLPRNKEIPSARALKADVLFPSWLINDTEMKKMINECLKSTEATGFKVKMTGIRGEN